MGLDPRDTPGPRSAAYFEGRLPARTVDDIPDSELLERAVRSARPRRGRGKQPKWVGVMDAFALGSTYAQQLCRRFGCDPEEMVKR